MLTLDSDVTARIYHVPHERKNSQHSSFLNSLTGVDGSDIYCPYAYGHPLRTHQCRQMCASAILVPKGEASPHR